MKTYGFRPRWGVGFVALLSSVLLSACSDPILGFDVVEPTIGPSVTVVLPAVNATGVPINTQVITTTLSEPIAAITDDASFTVTCLAPCINPEGAVSLDADNTTVRFTLTQGVLLVPATTYTATLSEVFAVAGGLPLAEPFVWTFETGPGPDVTRPSVTMTVPATTDPGPTPDVATNTAITAVFSEAIAAATVSELSFTVTCAEPCVNPAGDVSYDAGSMTALFAPTAELDANTTYTVTLTSAIEDLAGNALVGNEAPLPDAGNYLFTFTTAVDADTTAPTVVDTNPTNGAVGVCVNRSLSVTFSEPMDPTTLNEMTLTLSDDMGSAVDGMVSYDAITRIAQFSPVDDLVGSPATDYTLVIAGGADGAADLAGNSLAADVQVMFTTNSSVCAAPPDLGILESFGVFSGGGAVTNDGLETVINGDVGIFAASTSITGLRDSGGNVYTVTGDNDGMVNGFIYSLTAPPGLGLEDGAAVTAGMATASAAFVSLSPAALPGGIDMSDLMQCPSCGGVGDGADGLAGRTLPPGVYQSTTGTYDLGGPARSTEPLTLDAGGDADAVWVFQTADGIGTLNVGLTGPATPAVPMRVDLVNGAQAKNVFWYAPAGAVIGTGSNLVGTVLADAVITFSTTGGSPPTAVLTTVAGRAISLTGGVTMTNTVINVPTP